MHIAVLVKGYPRLSETFIAQEILALEQRGLRQQIVSLRFPTDKVVHELNRQIQAPVLYLPEYLHQEPRRVLNGWRKARHLPGYAAAFRAWRADWRRDPTPNRGRRWGQALVLAAEMPAGIEWVHTHYLHTPASVARYTAMMLGLPWSFSAHAKDIWTTPEWEKREKLADAAWGVTCTSYGLDHLQDLADRQDKVALVYHGLDFSRFPSPADRPSRDGSDPGDPVVLLSVGRTVEKKGFDLLLTALADLPDTLAWRWVHIGGGENLSALKAQATSLGLSDRVSFLGAQTQDVVIDHYIKADLFILPSRIAASGDRDGLPNVLMEAQALGLACLATSVAAIPELIVDGETGVLIPPDDRGALVQAMGRLISHPDRRLAFGNAGAVRVRTSFSSDTGIDILAQRFGLLRRVA